MKRLIVCQLVLAGLIGIAGCGAQYSKVEGVIQYEDGTPVDKATVVFIPTDPNGVSASGFTDAEGKFSLKTGNTEGARKGKYKVLVTKIASKGDKPMEPGSPEAIKAMKGGMSKGGPGMVGKSGPPSSKSEIAVEYSRAETTPLSQEVPASGTVTFKVKPAKKSS